MLKNPCCPFKNKFMAVPCGRVMLKNHNEWYCYTHGTMTYVREAWDPIETPSDTYEAENGGNSWTQEEEELILNMVDDEWPLGKIARVLGRTRNACYSKLWALRKIER